ncbi:amino acid transporter [Bacillus sp. ISL-47]|uniref:amino acid transporter n=1 Tax=Bacillus sp. ISL-47 TaxID=2819130 RepID=UPI001BE58EC9|nr:amino acid transporter [Bacillus sp. ISL-47]MBT2690588.1 amino acid transporter [Bacillus sp. ISL-47]MBT2708156.1 hypothetical protein [Pseudomonas sp. ISL-84]
MQDKKTFNDATDHLNKIEGYPANVELKKLPRPLRFFGYFFIIFFAVSVLFIIIMNFLD